MTGTTVLDLAAGTGKLTRQLVPTGAEIVAVEPVAAMRRKLEEAVPQVRAVEGTAEAIPLEDGSVDAVLCAQAFHWFDADRALAEIHRVLRAGGGLGLVWNVRDETFELERRLTKLLRRPRLRVPHRRWRGWRNAFARTAQFTELQQRKFAHAWKTDVETVVAGVASMSYVSALPDDERERFLEEVRRLAESVGPPLVMHYRTEVYWCRRRG